MQKSKPLLRGGISHGPYGTKEACYATKHPLMLTSVLVLAYMIFSGFFRCVLSVMLHPAPFARPAHACGLAGELGKMAELNLWLRERTGKAQHGALPVCPPMRATHHHHLSHSFLTQLVFLPFTGGLFASSSPSWTRCTSSPTTRSEARQRFGLFASSGSTS